MALYIEIARGKTLTDSLAKEGLWTLFFSQTNNTKESLLLQGDFAKEVL